VVVHATGCDKYSFIDASRLCGKPHGRLSHLLFARPARHRSIAISYIADDRDLAYGTCIRRHRWGGPCRNVAMTFGTEKLEWFGYPMVKKIDNVFIRFDRIHERDRQTDRRTDTA